MSLAHLRARLCGVYDSIQSFEVPLPHPPVISHDKDSREALPGLRSLREEVKRDCNVLDKLHEDACSSALSTNAPYLIAVWDEVVHARQPVAIYRTFSLANGQNKAAKGREKRTTPQGKTGLKSQSRPVKVDVVAGNGARWVRVNTIKNARLMMEFREIDSYLTSDEDEGEDELRPRFAQTEFDNSLLRMGRELVAAAKANPVLVPTPLSDFVPDSNSITPNPNTTMTPQVTLRLTRLDPSLKDDPRVEKTIQCLRDMGIDVQLGERPYPYCAPTPETPTKLKLLEPTTDINLDLSALIALISDISHSPLPRTEQEAYARFQPPQSYLDWKKDSVKLLAHQSQSQGTHHSLYDAEDGEDEGGTCENSGQHSRALATQAIQEMNKGFLEEIHERISAAVTQPSRDVTFWTTSEARHRCLQIVSRIGGKRERQRADALLCANIPPAPAPAHILPNGIARTGWMLEATPGMDNAEWKASSDAYWEHSRHPTGFLPLVPVHVYPSNLPPVEAEDQQSRTTFFNALTRTCAGILSHEAAPVSQVSAASDLLPTAKEVLEEIPPVTQTWLPKLTVHTVTSMLAGASRGYTTLTTNKSSVKAVLKEMRRVCGRGGHEPEMGDVQKAALWVVDPRSLSEGMRSEERS